MTIVAPGICEFCGDKNDRIYLLFGVYVCEDAVACLQRYAGGLDDGYAKDVVMELIEKRERNDEAQNN